MAGPPRKTLRTDAQALLQGCAGLNSRLAARRLSRYFDRELAASGLSLAQLGLLAQIATASDDRLGALAQRAGLDPSTLSRNLRTLQAEGLIEIATVEADLRRRAVWLTESGARRLEAALPAWREANGAVSRRLSTDLAWLAEAAGRLDP